MCPGLNRPYDWCDLYLKTAARRRHKARQVRRTKARILDEYLAAASRAGDRRAFERLAARFQPRLLRHAYRLTGEMEVARDAVQDAWADIVRGLPRLKDAALFPAWAFRIVTRRAADRIRRVQRSRRTKNALAAEPVCAGETGEGIEAKTDASLCSGPLARALATLSNEQRAAIVLFHLEEMSVAEIAVALNVPAGTVKTRLMHARRKLREALEGGKSDERT